MRLPTRGNVLVIVALSLSSILGFGALVVDVGYLRIVDAQLQMAADASTHAGASQLDGTSEGLVAASDASSDFAQRNQVNGVALDVALSGGIELDYGYWDWDSHSFVESADPEEVDAVALELEMNDVSTFLAGASFGIDTLRAHARSVAVRPPPEGAGAVECVMPIAIPSCTFTEYGEGEWNYVEFEFSSDAEDNIGWSMLNTKPNANNVKDLITDCSALGEVTNGDEVYLNNGELASAMKALATAVEDSDTAWDSSVWGTQPTQASKSAIDAVEYGNTFEGPIVIFSSDDCSDVKYNGTASISGFAWGAVYDVVATGGDKNIRMRLETSDDYDFGTQGGGDLDVGVTFQPPTMIVH